MHRFLCKSEAPALIPRLGLDPAPLREHGPFQAKSIVIPIK